MEGSHSPVSRCLGLFVLPVTWRCLEALMFNPFTGTRSWREPAAAQIYRTQEMENNGKRLTTGRNFSHNSSLFSTAGHLGWVMRNACVSSGLTALVHHVLKTHVLIPKGTD